MAPVWIAAIAISLTGSSVEMNITLDGTKVGTARMTQKLTPEGGKSTQSRIELNSQGKTSTVIEESEYDAEGRPLRKYLRNTGFAGTEMRVATFSDKGANIVIELNGTRDTKKIAMPEGDTRAASEMWFIKTQPKAGDTATYFRFDMNKLEWSKCEVSYKGKQNNAHYTEMKGGYKAWLSDDGLPMRMVAGRVVFERIFK